MDTWGPVNPIESNQHDDNRPEISGDQTTVRWGTDGNSSGARIVVTTCLMAGCATNLDDVCRIAVGLRNNSCCLPIKMGRRSPVPINNRRETMATRKITAKPKTQEKSQAITLEEALKEEGEGRTHESIRNEGKKPDGASKMDQATKIMEEMWQDLQAGKVKRKDVIQRFMEEVHLSKAGSSTYYGTIKARLLKRE